MDGSNLYNLSNNVRDSMSTIEKMGSLRSNSSAIWRNSGMEVFSKSARDEDDEEALKWASLEKLPTFDRLRRGLLLGTEVDVHDLGTEVDVHDLGTEERKNLLDRLVNIAEEDNEKFLLKLRDRVDRVGINLHQIEVQFEHLKIEAEVHVGSRASPSFLNFCLGIVEGFLDTLHIISSKKERFTILNDVSGIIRPCRMTLLLGPPSSGKTTLLLALAGKLDPTLKFSGSVTYNGHEMTDFVPKKTAAYISQYDLHIGELTVRETLAFSARCQGVRSRYVQAAATEGQEASVVTEYVLKVLGLDVCADTIVGNQMIRGISGGQRKRVTTGEMLVGPSKALFMDEISTGLDSSTTYQIVNALRNSVHILQGTALISLLQPDPETYDLFDDIIILSDGQIVYQGPREYVLEFFESMGFRCPERKGVADFLQEVTSKKDQKQYWLQKDEPYRFITAMEFSEGYQSFHSGVRLGDDLATPYDKSRSHPAALATDRHGISKKELLKAVTAREILLIKRNSFVYIFKLSQLTTIAIVTMTLFLRTEFHRNSTTDGGIYMGALFFAVVMLMFNGFEEISMTIAKLPVFYKQRDLLFYPAWSYALPVWIIKIPITFLEVAVWVVLTYYVIGFDPDVGRFLKQYVVLLLINQMASALFRLMAALGRNMILAMAFGGFALLVLFALGGFVLARENVAKWWLWGYYSSPMMYAMNAIAVNEFLGHQWHKPVVNGTETIGVAILKSRGFFPYSYWYWIGVGALIGFVLLLNFAVTMALTYLDPLGKPQTVSPEKDPTDVIVLSSRKGNSRGKAGSHGIHDEASENKKKGMILPFEPHSITFDEVRYSVAMPLEMKDQGVAEDKLLLLKGVSGSFRPGVLTALMGVSGAGKTTLMDVLSGRKTGGYIEGNIMISGFPKKQETFARICGYCEQNDIHSPHVTVYESLIFSAWLRLPSNVDPTTRKMFVDEVLELVELNTLKAGLVGIPGVNGLSTEQRKRLTIAVELVANPSIIFMDEPTSGLDARAAAVVMRTVRNTVDTGRTVVCSIHQPSIDIFEAFDEGIEGTNKIKDGYNPATWMLEVTASAQERVLGVDFTEIYHNSYLYRRTQQDLFNAMGSMYAACIFLGVQNASSVRPVVDVERTVFYRERAAGMYSALPYAFAQDLTGQW
ncbi:hypothetical protein AgCh_016183 [Apium graveolens]